MAVGKEVLVFRLHTQPAKPAKGLGGGDSRHGLPMKFFSVKSYQRSLVGGGIEYFLFLLAD